MTSQFNVRNAAGYEQLMGPLEPKTCVVVPPKFETRTGYFFETFAPLSFSARIRRRQSS